MSKFTTEVRFICATLSGHSTAGGLNRINEDIAGSRASIFGDYPIFDEAYREVLETKILKHYYTREISEEVVPLWLLRVNTKMNEIMPFYNQLYRSELLQFNPLYDVDISRSRVASSTSEGSGKSKSEGRSESTGQSVRENETSSETSNEAHSTGMGNNKTEAGKTQRDLYSDTPSGALDGVESGNYLTNARKISAEDKSSEVNSQVSDSNGKTEYSDKVNGKSSDITSASSGSESSSESTAKSTEDYLEKISGKQGSGTYSKMLMEYRETFLNIDLKIIDDLNGLFFGLWE